MMFGNATEPDTQQPSLSDYISGNGNGSQSDRSERYEEYKAKAAHVAGRVGEKASELKASASNWFSQFTAKEEQF